MASEGAVSLIGFETRFWYYFLTWKDALGPKQFEREFFDIGSEMDAESAKLIDTDEFCKDS